MYSDVTMHSRTTTIHTTAEDILHLYQIIATDDDRSQTVTYHILDGDTSQLSVDAVTGWLDLNRPLDREERTMWTMGVVATDNGRSNMHDSIAVRNVNDQL